MIGKTISHYHITAKIGGGAMGVVYKAEDTKLKRVVALKFLAEDRIKDSAARKRFVREAQAAAAIDHSNVCHIYEINETPDGQTFIVMSFCEGETLQKRMESGRMTLEDALEIGIGIAEGLAPAHARNIIHRDLKPGNIMLTGEGIPKIVDFGLAMLSDRTRLTQSGMTMGTLLYMSPEQARGEDIDGRSDIFSLGVVMYELITGVSPFRTDNEAAIVYKIVSEDPEPVSTHRKNIPSQLDQIVTHALAKEPGERYQTVTEMRDDLRKVLLEIAPERVRVLPKPPRSGWGEFFAVHRGRMVVATVVAFALIAGIWQRNALMRWFGLNSDGGSLDVAVLAPGPVMEGDSSTVIAAGLAADISNRLTWMARDKPFLWAVPQDQLRNQNVAAAKDAPRLVGANRVFTVRSEPMTNPPALSLQMHNARETPVRLVEECEFNLHERKFNSSAFDSIVADMLAISSASGPVPGYTGDVEAYCAYLEGLGHFASGRKGLPLAITSFERAVGIDANFARAHEALGASYRLHFARSKDAEYADKTEESCRKALSILPDLADAHVTLGRLFQSKKDEAAAIEEFRQALVVNPRHENALRRLADIYSRLGRLDDAEAVYVRATAMNPRNYSAYEIFGFFYYMNEKYGAAIGKFQKVAQLAPDYGETYNYLGACYFALECWDRAIAMFEKSFNLGRNYAACANLGTLYYIKGNFPDAAQMYQWALEYAPSSYEAMGYLADAYYWQNDERKQALKLYKEAAKLAEEARIQQPEDSRLLALLAGYYSIILPDSAYGLVETALELAPEDPGILYRAAVIYAVLDEKEKALVYLGRALDLAYSLRQIESEQFLSELREDARYKILTSNIERKEVNCENPKLE